MSYLEELLPMFRKGAKIRRKVWSAGEYIQIQNGKVYVNSSKQELVTLSCESFTVNDWEFYQEPIDWDYIIKHKCLCWFWDDNEKSKTLKFLTNVHMEAEYRFNGFWPVHGNCTYKHCCPVRKDEVTFYEERKDE